MHSPDTVSVLLSTYIVFVCSLGDDTCTEVSCGGTFACGTAPLTFALEDWCSCQHIF